MRTKVLFVCLGNICRSPLAEGIFKKLIAEAEENGDLTADQARAFRIESAGTGSWHCGEPPDPRALRVAKENKVPMDTLGRQVKPSDFFEFDLLLCMDTQNRRDLLHLSPPEHRSKIRLLRYYDDSAHRGKDVPDPYYGDESHFHDIFLIQARCCRNLMASLLKKEEP